jgi:hypothetical protein
LCADDILFFSHNLKSIQNAISALQSHPWEIELDIEPSETESLVENDNDSQCSRRSIGQGYRKYVIKILLITLGFLLAQLLQPCNTWHCQLHWIKIMKKHSPAS